MPEAFPDTSIVIDFLKARPEALAAINSLRRGGPVLLHSVVQAEIIAGALDRRDLRGGRNASSRPARL